VKFGWTNQFPLQIDGGQTDIERLYYELVAGWGNRTKAGGPEDELLISMAKAIRTVNAWPGRTLLESIPDRAIDNLPEFERLCRIVVPEGAWRLERQQEVGRVWTELQSAVFFKMRNGIKAIDSRFELVPHPTATATRTVPGLPFEPQDGSFPFRFTGGRTHSLFANLSTDFKWRVQLVGATAPLTGADIDAIDKAKAYMGKRLPVWNSFNFVTKVGFILDVDPLDLTAFGSEPSVTTMQQLITDAGGTVAQYMLAEDASASLWPARTGTDGADVNNPLYVAGGWHDGLRDVVDFDGSSVDHITLHHLAAARAADPDAPMTFALPYERKGGAGTVFGFSAAAAGTLLWQLQDDGDGTFTFFTRTAGGVIKDSISGAAVLPVDTPCILSLSYTGTNLNVEAKTAIETISLIDNATTVALSPGDFPFDTCALGAIPRATPANDVEALMGGLIYSPDVGLSNSDQTTLNSLFAEIFPL